MATHKQNVTNGCPLHHDIKGMIADITPAQVVTANATDLATAQALANQLKATLNTLLDALSKLDDN